MTLGTEQATTAQKEEFIKIITEQAAKIIKLPAHTFTILIHENDPENIGIGGKTLREVQAALK